MNLSNSCANLITNRPKHAQLSNYAHLALQNHTEMHKIEPKFVLIDSQQRANLLTNQSAQFVRRTCEHMPVPVLIKGAIVSSKQNREHKVFLINSTRISKNLISIQWFMTV